MRYVVVPAAHQNGGAAELLDLVPGDVPDPAGEPRPVDGREDATTALTVLVAQQHVWALRVHDVRVSRDALLTLARWQEG